MQHTGHFSDFSSSIGNGTVTVLGCNPDLRQTAARRRSRKFALRFVCEYVYISVGVQVPYVHGSRKRILAAALYF